MPPLLRLKSRLFSLLHPLKEPRAAYDQWSEDYDNQAGNLMLALDEQLVSELLRNLPQSLPVMADIGCGTGRHWDKWYAFNPERLVGCDVSEGMLDQLKKKYPGSETHLLTDNGALPLGDESCDLVISTLTIAHIQNPEYALWEWYRVLKPGGSMIITDYHPDALSNGARRTFMHKQRLFAIKNYIYPIEQITAYSRQLGMEIKRFSERTIDHSVRPFYEKQRALAVYENFFGMKIIYGIQLKKPDAHSAG